MYQRKFSIKDIGHVLYGLAYSDDADRERGLKLLWDLDWKIVKKTIQGWLRELAG